MTQDDTFLTLSQSVREQILHRQLHDALYLLRSMIELLTDADDLMRQCTDITEEYRLLLAQAGRERADDKCKEHQQTLLQRALLLLQRTRRHKRLQQGTDIYSRTHALLKENGTIQKEEQLFNEIWTSDQLQEEVLNEYLQGSEADERKKQVIAGALTLSLLEYFDPNKFSVLLTLSADVHPSTQGKALLGVVVAAEMHADVIPFFPHLMRSSGEMLNADSLLILQQQICLVQENEKLQQRFKNDIIPNVIKAHKDDMPSTPEVHEVKINLSKNDPVLTKRLQRKIGESFQQMTKLMSDGLDPTPAAFDDLKRLPFFTHVSHWLLPFDGTLVNGKLTEEIASLNLCDTDKYVLAFLVKTTPDELAEKLLFQLKKRETDQHPNSEREDKQRNTSYRNGVQDLIRLLRYSGWKDQWPSVLADNILFITIPLLKDILKNNHRYLEKTLDIYRKYERYEQSKILLEQKIKVLGASVLDYLGLAICEHEGGNDSQAVRYLRMAETLSPSDPQIMDLLQQAYAGTGQTAARTEILLQMEELRPDDVDITLSLADCYVQQKMWKDAIQRFYKLEFSNQHITDALRGVAWCAFMQGNLSKARQYYDRILSGGEATWEEWLNSGHVAWKEGNIPVSIKHYVQSAKKYMLENPRTTNALKPFEDDKETLLSLNFEENEIGLIHDLISVSL